MALAIGEHAIPFDLPGVDGKNHTLADYGDREAIAIIFTCNHCPYVLAWEGRLIAVQRDYADKGVQLIGIGSNDAAKYPADNFENMKQHAADKNFNFPYLRDETQEVATAYGAERTPEIFLFDKTGKLRYHGTIDDNYENPDAVSATYFRDALDAMLADSSIETPQTAPVGCTIKWK
ncbi:MAG: thioredoxin family protein [Chloroflexota bacterium]